MTLVLLILLFPFIGFLLNGLGFRRLPASLAGLIGTGTVLASFVGVVMLFMGFSGNPQVYHAFEWIHTADLSIPFGFQIDQLSLVMMLIITGIGTLIHLYSIGYMHADEGYGKFMAFLNLFIFFMLMLVMASNYVGMFIGWEGVGFCSYLLIGFWNKNTEYGYAARKAFIMNRIGDVGFLMGVFLMLFQFGSVEYGEVFPEAARLAVGNNVVTWITLCLFVGAMGKSAQIPLFTWLPDAMAGPTPVSALIHAATMVTAGIYMVVRSNVLYTLSPDTLHLIAWVAIGTALLAASIGLFQNDIKKVLAYSTVSQLGYMFLGLGVGAYSAGFFHVLTHAFFKALLFLGAGSVIHAMGGEQDLRHMGGLRSKLPVTFATFLIGTLAISGIPPFAGFFSKDEILAQVFSHSPLLWGLGVLGSMLTAFYMFRLLFLTFFGEFRGTHEQRHHLHESPLTMTLPLMVLAGLSVAGGLLNVPAILGGSARLSGFLQPIYRFSQEVQGRVQHPHLDHATEMMLMGISVAAAVVAIVAAYITYVSRRAVPVADGQQQGLQKLVYHKYYIDELYDRAIVRPVQGLSGFLHRTVDELLIDTLGVGGVGRFAKGLGSEFRLAQTGMTSFYVTVMVLGLALMLLYGLRMFILPS